MIAISRIDPRACLTPDVVADISDACVAQVARNTVRLSGVRGHPPPELLKANVFHEHGWLAEGEISYAGPGAESRARLAPTCSDRGLPRVARFEST